MSDVIILRKIDPGQFLDKTSPKKMQSRIGNGIGDLACGTIFYESLLNLFSSMASKGYFSGEMYKCLLNTLMKKFSWQNSVCNVLSAWVYFNTK